MPVSTTGYGHVRLTVTDVARARASYDLVFGFPVAVEVPPTPTRRPLPVANGGVEDVGVASVLELRDPDGIALELVASA